MKRDPALLSLSHDHHQALFAAQRLRRASRLTADAARTAFIRFWESEGHDHFRQEEEILLPAFAAYGDPHHPLVARSLCDHVVIRRLAADVVAAPCEPALLHELGTRLAEHVRLEERELFPMIEDALPDYARGELARLLEP
jgi:iron-sulfur cluster repair protein YtfE (RIC family)